MRGHVKVRGGVSIVLGICAILVAAFCAYGVRLVSAQSGTGWANMLYQNFSGPAGQTVDSKYWKYDTGSGNDFGNGEVGTMTDSPKNVSLDGAGNLDITALGQGSSWTSGRIQTTNLYGAPAGGEMKVVASIKQPSPVDGLGYWPAFWLLGPGTWPENGEIDVLEDVNALSLVSGALHCGNLVSLNPDRTAGPCHEHIGLSSGMRSCAGCQSGYHTYSVIVDRRDKADEQISWYLDDRKFYEISERQVGTQVWTEAVDHGFSIIFDLAIGGSYPNGRCGCVTPTSLTSSGGMMSVRYLAVYDR